MSEDNQEQTDSLPFPPEIREKALEQIRSLVKGNGLKPSSVTLDSFEGAVLQFPAFHHFKIDPQTSEKRLSGRQNGTVLASRSDMQNRLQQDVEALGQDKELRGIVTKLLQERGDLGFANDGLILSLQKYNRSYVVHEQCGSCKGSGKMRCNACHGQRQITCPRCQGSRDSQCPQCQGMKFINGPGGRQPCTRCHQRGRIPCQNCNQRGTIQCTHCRGTGDVDCKTCNGNGWSSLITTLMVKVKSRFEIPEEALPPAARQIVLEQGPALVTQKQAMVKLLGDVSEDSSADSGFTIVYGVDLPWAEAVFHLKNRPVPGIVFGLLPALHQVPDFLDKLIAGGASELRRITPSSGHSGQVIKKAVRYRALRDIVLAASRLPPGKALSAVKKHYPVGLSDNLIKEMVVSADRALKNITRGPRLTGLAVGVLAVTGLYGLYFLGPVRPVMASQITDETVLAALDFILLVAGGILTTLSIKIAARRAYYQVFSRLMPPDKARRLTPKAGHSGWIGYAGILIVYVVILEISRIMPEVATPAWYDAFRGTLPF
ncbi:MAG: hypothetical protein H6868_01530 [Rhodospirillales bacterium]|nr:hypothetical protein [Rhodospirillales bacterium]